MNRPNRHKRTPRRRRIRAISHVYLVGDEDETVCAVFDSEAKALLFVTMMEDEYNEDFLYLGEWDIL